MEWLQLTERLAPRCGGCEADLGIHTVAFEAGGGGCVALLLHLAAEAAVNMLLSAG